MVGLGKGKNMGFLLWEKMTYYASRLNNTTVLKNLVILTNETLENVIICLQVMKIKIHLLQSQSQLLNHEIRDLKNQQLVKNSKLTLI